MDMIGRMLSHYRVIEKLGEGGMGAVFRAEDVRLGRQVALKTLPALREADDRDRQRFLAEARALALLEHPHICLLYELGEAEGEPFLAMQLVEGESLGQLVRRGRLAVDRALEVVQVVASALGAAHARGIVHLDVKCDNILLGRDGSIKLTDFGLARLSEVASHSSRSALAGTAAYMAPEQIEGRGAGAAADQFALGVVAYECLTGTRPFTGDSLMTVMYAICNTEPPPVSRARPELTLRWDETISRALHKDPSRRFPGVREFGAALSLQGATASPRNQRPALTSLAVLYFENLSPFPDTDYFCAGITEDILTDLSKLPGLQVASRNAVARLRGQAVDIPRVAAELGVGAVLEGSVRRSGTQVRITAQLIDAATGFHLWAERYDRQLEDVFAVQEDIARSIAGALRGALTSEETAGLQQGRPANAWAYDLYLKGRALYTQYVFEDNRRALEMFEQALAIEPDYALAWAGVADCCGQIIDKAWDASPGWLDRGLAAARRSVELDPRLPEAYKALALIQEMRGELDESRSSLHRAIEINPRFESALVNLSSLILETGDVARFERCLRRVLEIDPTSSYAYLWLGLGLMLTHRFHEAIEVTRRLQALDQSPYYEEFSLLVRIISFGNLADAAGARSELKSLERSLPGAGWTGDARAYIALLEGDPEPGRRLLESSALERTGPSTGSELRVDLAARLGDAHRAVALLRRAEHDPGMEWARKFAILRVQPGLRSIRESSEFRAWIGSRGSRMVWPLEAPALSFEDRAQFTDYSEASGLVQGADVP